MTHYIKKQIALLILTIPIIFISCQSNTKAVEVQGPVFDIPYLLTLDQGQMQTQLGKPTYTASYNKFDMKTKYGPITIPSETQAVIYISNGYRAEFYFVPEKLQHPAGVFICREDAALLDSSGLNNIRKAGSLLNEKVLPVTAEIIPGKNGITINNIQQ